MLSLTIICYFEAASVTFANYDTKIIAYQHLDLNPHPRTHYLHSDNMETVNGDIATDSQQTTSSITNANDNKSHKRKGAFSLATHHEEEKIDKEFLEADRQLLSKIRANDYPSHTRSTVLSKPGSVSDFSVVVVVVSDVVVTELLIDTYRL